MGDFVKSGLFFFLFFGCVVKAQQLSPEDFLPQYSRHVSYYHQVISYFNHLADKSDKIQKLSYGFTPQDRELSVYFISAPENLENLERIRENHLHGIGLYPQKNAMKDKAIVWLSFGVHGNEIGATESALNIAYKLVSDSEKESWLEDLIIILDPCLNPDGFSRYANWLRDVSGVQIHPGLQDREHMEPWPGGRHNHYVYDLNRDWAWQTQPESIQRMNLYHDWMPMIHVDVHEMGFNEPYFFPPASEPYHEQISDFQRDFHKKIGEITSKKFDLKNWMYYSGERFDLFYPSYGDTYPCFNGAVGMTYEQGGIGAGRAVLMKNGEILTLRNRIDHHTVAVLTAVELSHVMKEKLINSFRAYFRDSRRKPKGQYHTYIIKKSFKNEELINMLNKNRIEFFYADESKKLKGFCYQSHEMVSFTLQPDDLVIKADQPRSVLTQVLFEPYHKLSDSLSYDITAWALPWAFGVEGYALKGFPSLKIRKEKGEEVRREFKDSRAYAYYIPWCNRKSVSVLSALHQSGIKVRVALKEATVDSVTIRRGGLIVNFSDNKSRKDLDSVLKEILGSVSGIEILYSGFSEKGGNLGGENYPLLTIPKILLFSGQGVGAVEFGQVWYYLDQVIQYPVSVMDIRFFSQINFNEYNTLIFPNGSYSLSDKELGKLDEFVVKGGKVITLEGALSLFEGREGYQLKAFATEENEKDISEKNRKLVYEGLERNDISSLITGAVIENRIDSTHPVTFGLANPYYSLKTSERTFQLLPSDAHNCIYVPKEYKSSGFIGSDKKRILEESITVAVDRKGLGKVVYMVDNPLYRGFWENGFLLFGNALFLTSILK